MIKEREDLADRKGLMLNQVQILQVARRIAANLQVSLHRVIMAALQMQRQKAEQQELHRLLNTRK